MCASRVAASAPEASGSAAATDEAVSRTRRDHSAGRYRVAARTAVAPANAIGPAPPAAPRQWRQRDGSGPSHTW